MPADQKRSDVPGTAEGGDVRPPPGVAAAHWPLAGQDSSEMLGAGATMRHLTIKAGHVAARHHHEFEQFLFVVSGGGRLLCEEGAIPLKPGTSLHLPPGAWHSAEFTADTALLEVNLGQPAP